MFAPWIGTSLTILHHYKKKLQKLTPPHMLLRYSAKFHLNAQKMFLFSEKKHIPFIKTDAYFYTAVIFLTYPQKMILIKFFTPKNQENDTFHLLELLNMSGQRSGQWCNRLGNKVLIQLRIQRYLLIHVATPQLGQPQDCKSNQLD